MPVFKNIFNYPEKFIDPSVSHEFLLDMKRLDIDCLYLRLERHLSSHTFNQFIIDLLAAINKPTFLDLFKRKYYYRIRTRRRRKIFKFAQELLLNEDIKYGLYLLNGTKDFITDRKFNLHFVKKLDELGRKDEAKAIFQSFNRRFKHRSKDTLTGRLIWWRQDANEISIKKILESGYDLDFLTPALDYSPIKGRVLYHIHASINHNTSGYSTRSHYICKSLIEHGMDLHVRTRWGFPYDRKDFDSTAYDLSPNTVDNVTYLHDPIKQALGRYDMEEYVQKAADSLLQTALKCRPATMQAASNFAVGYPAAIVARALGIPFVYEMRGLWPLTRASKDELYRYQDKFILEMALEKHLALAADRVIVITDALRSRVIEWGVPPEKISVALNGVDTSMFTVKKRSVEIEKELMLSGKTVIGYIGSLLKYEGLDLLFDAIASFPDSIKKDIAVIIVGDGDYRQVLEAKSESLQLTGIVHFVGRVPIEKVADYYSLIDISPFPRIAAEVCELISPLKPLEAMAMGSAVVASNVRAIAEHVIPEKNGLMFEKGCSSDLAEKLLILIRNKSYRTQLTQQARVWVEENRSWPLITSHIKCIHDQLESNVELTPIRHDARISK